VALEATVKVASEVTVVASEVAEEDTTTMTISPTDLLVVVTIDLLVMVLNQEKREGKEDPTIMTVRIPAPDTMKAPL